MAILGVVAEFNPFHNGHLYLLEEARRYENFAAAVCVMSGNFLQRGEPALCNKWSRAHMAVAAGADLVIEIPFCFAVRSAYFFARGAMELLYRTGVVTHVAFGSESGNIDELRSIASIIAHESDEYQSILRYHLDQGISFPAARSRAVQAVSDIADSQVENILMQPNNILALEYLRVLDQESIPLQPLTIPRQGAGYHSTELSSYASASAIRRSILENGALDRAGQFMPASSIHILQSELSAGRSPIVQRSLEQSILLHLRTTPAETLGNINEVTEGLEYKIHRAAMTCTNLDDLCQAVKSKRYSMTRIKRILLYALLGISHQKVQLFDQYGPLYLHILAFSTQGQKILQQMKNNSHARILSRGSDFKKAHASSNEPVLSAMLDLDRKATDIYTLFYPNQAYARGGQDFTTSPVRSDRHC